MMIRSMPPASAHLALMPVPAPPPIIGLPAATWARRRSRHCSRVKKLMGSSLTLPVGAGLAGLIGSLVAERATNDVFEPRQSQENKGGHDAHDSSQDEDQVF